MLLRGNEGAGYIRVDWYSPDGLETWGDGRLILLGTEGYIELRKNCDIADAPEKIIFFWLIKKEHNISIVRLSICRTGSNRQRHPQPHRNRDVAGALFSGLRTSVNGLNSGRKD